MPIVDPNNSGRKQWLVPTEAEICEECKRLNEEWDEATEAQRRNFTICRCGKDGKRFTPRSGQQDAPYEFPSEH